MTTAVGAEKRRAPPLSALVLLVLAAGAWIATIVCIIALDMSLEAGTMGLSIGEFVVMWTLMMAAMMLPAISPLVSMYARSVQGSASALTAFGAGYLVVWAATGVIAYALTWLFG
jgi:predicted metal-binding membrane protein